MWRQVTLAARGYLDGVAMDLLAEHFGLDWFRISRAREVGPGVPCDLNSRTWGKRDVYLVLYDGFGHLKALVPVESTPMGRPDSSNLV